MMHFINMLTFSPESIWLRDENEIFFFVISHFCNVVKVHAVNKTHKRANVHSVSWSDNRSLSTILDIHVVVIITISDTFKSPSGTILELSWDIEPIPLLSHPLKRWCTITLIDFEDIESWRQAENSESASFPEFNPLTNSLVLVDHFTFFEVKSGIWLHWWCLHERLELITWVSWCSFETENSLDRLFTKKWESESGGDMREFLALSPLAIVWHTFIVIVMVSSRLVSQSFLHLKLNGIGLSGWLSPSVVVLEEHVVQMEIVSIGRSNLVHVWWNVANFVINAWSHLSNVHIDQETIVSVDFEKLVFSEVLGIKVVLNITMLVRKDYIRVLKFVSWSFEIVDLKILRLLVLIKTEIVVALSSYLIISISLKSNLFFLCKLVLKAHFLHFLLEQFSNLVLDRFDLGMVVWANIGKGSKEVLSSIDISEHIGVILLLSSCSSLTSDSDVRYLPLS